MEMAFYKIKMANYVKVRHLDKWMRSIIIVGGELHKSPPPTLLTYTPDLHSQPTFLFLHCHHAIFNMNGIATFDAVVYFFRYNIQSFLPVTFHADGVGFTVTELSSN